MMATRYQVAIIFVRVPWNHTKSRLYSIKIEMIGFAGRSNYWSPFQFRKEVIAAIEDLNRIVLT